MTSNVVHLAPRRVVPFDKERARAAEKAALATACSLVGVTYEQLARVLGEDPQRVRAWASPSRPDLSLPAWALRRIEAALPALGAALQHELDRSPTAQPLTDHSVVALARALAEVLLSVSTDARHTSQGASAALAALHRLQPLLRSAGESLSNTCTTMRAA